jgi:protein involved in polysaccharide export with SLBB domain
MPFRNLRNIRLGSIAFGGVFRRAPKGRLRFTLALILVSLGAVSAWSQKYASVPPEFFAANQPGRPMMIVPGDVLAVRFYYNPELNKTVKVREDGKISLDMFQGIEAGGMTPEDLQKKLVEMYSHEFTNPVITIDVQTSSSASVYVTGEVQSPGTQEWHGNLTLAMALAVSHVNQKTAGLKSVFLIRATDPGRFSAYKLDASMPVGKSRDLQIMPGDVLFVPRKFIVKADDFMEQYVRELLPATPSAAADVIFAPGNPVVTTSSATATP